MPIPDQVLAFLTLLVALGCGLFAGLLFAFSNFVMKALARIPPDNGIEAMQTINVTIINPTFIALFIGTAIGSLVLVADAFVRMPDSGSGVVIAGGLLHLLGGVGITLAFNVPRNNALERVRASDPASAEIWRRYVTEWTRWNHVRTVASLGAAALLTYALIGFGNGAG